MVLIRFLVYFMCYCESCNKNTRFRVGPVDYVHSFTIVSLRSNGLTLLVIGLFIVVFILLLLLLLVVVVVVLKITAYKRDKWVADGLLFCAHLWSCLPSPLIGHVSRSDTASACYRWYGREDLPTIQKL